MSIIAARAHPESASNWPDPVLAPSLRMAAESMCVFGGFLMVSVSVARGDTMRNVAVARTASMLTPDGEQASMQTLLEASYPVEGMESLISHMESWGALQFLSHERGVHHNTWRLDHTFDHRHPDQEHADGRRPWHPDDMLVVPIRDDAGGLRGMIRLDGPVDGMVPAGEDRERLDGYASQAARAVTAVLENEERGKQVRLLEAARLLIRSVAATSTFEEAFDQAAPILTRAFDLTGIRLETFEPHQMLSRGEAPGIAPSWTERWESYAEIRRRASEILWADQEVSIVGLNQVLNIRTTPARVDEIKHALSGAGLDSVVLVPVGAADRCIGALWLYRRDGRWSDHELRVLQDVGRDIGRLVVNAQALQAEHQLTEQMQELEHYKRTLISMISHELKTPLSGILANAEFLVGAESPADIQRSARAMARGASRMTGLVEELLMIARLDQPGRDSEAGPVRLAEIAREAIELHRPVADRAQVTIALTADEEAVVTGSADDLLVMVANLVGNAVKYSHAEGRVQVTITTTSGEGVIEVVDSGIGMDPEDLERLFGEFERGTDPATLARPGSGLGLAIVDRIVRNHGGTVEVISARDEGSTFRVRLPV
jgi:signal transduction histidine kinase